jgi:hypothetical protein
LSTTAAHLGDSETEKEAFFLYLRCTLPHLLRRQQVCGKETDEMPKVRYRKDEPLIRLLLSNMEDS